MSLNSTGLLVASEVTHYSDCDLIIKPAQWYHVVCVSPLWPVAQRLTVIATVVKWISIIFAIQHTLSEEMSGN